MPTTFVAEYVWIVSDENDEAPDMRSKARVLTCLDEVTLDAIPVWNYDGSSTGQVASTAVSELMLFPMCMCIDPFRGAPHVLVLCDTSARNSTRARAMAVFDPDVVAVDEPWFGLEQEYVIMQGARPLNWAQMSSLTSKLTAYCALDVSGREIANEHLAACLKAGLTISGMNGEVMLSQWEFQIGPCTGVKAADQLWLARYILMRIAESKQVGISFHPKVAGPGFSGSGCHANFSTAAMRSSYSKFEPFLNALAADHAEIMNTNDYGAHNELRLTGECETASIACFCYGVGNRSASVRVPVQTFKEQRGYLEDRRPAANADPYMVTRYLYSIWRRIAASTGATK